MSRRKEPTPADRKPAPDSKPAASRPMQRLLILALLFLASALGVYLAVRFLDRPTLSPDLVGEWRIVGGEMNGARLIYGADGTFQAKWTEGGRAVTMEARVEQHGDRLHYAVFDPASGRTVDKVQTILSLSPSELIIEENRRRSRLVRSKSDP